MHWSPFEHVATPILMHSMDEVEASNFKGWNQYRKYFRDENRTDPFVKTSEVGHGTV